MGKLFKIFPPLAGLVLLLLMVWLNLKYGITYSSLRGFSNILDSTVNFLSIVIGFYSAFYGMIISMQKTRFITELSKSKHRNDLPRLLVSSLCSSFLCLILTIVMQSLIEYKLQITTVLFYAWFFLVGLFITYAFQTSMLSITMIFESDPQKKQKKNLKM